MKRAIAILLVTMLSFSGYSQSFQINPFASYQLGGKIKLDQGPNLEFANGVNFGIGLSKGFDGRNIEFSYTQFLTEVSNGTKTEKATMGYIQAGLVQDLNRDSGSDLVPFVLATVGSNYIKVNNVSGSYWSFTIGLGGGIKYFFSDVVGMRLQARFLLPMYFGSYYYYGYYYSNFRALPQGDFSGGLVFRIGG